MSQEPSELSRQLTLLKGNRTTAEIVHGANVSRETFRKIERGLQSVKLDTLMDIADFLKATDQQRTDLLVAWAKLALGEHAKRIRITPQTSTLKDAPDEIQTILKQLSPYERQQFTLAMVRPEVRQAIPALNKLHDTLKARQDTRKASPGKK